MIFSEDWSTVVTGSILHYTKNRLKYVKTMNDMYIIRHHKIIYSKEKKRLACSSENCEFFGWDQLTVEAPSEIITRSYNF